MRRYSRALQEIVEARGLSVQERLRSVVDTSLVIFAREPDAFAFVLGHQARFIGALPAGFPFSIRVLERLVRAGQRDGSVRSGPVRLLTALVFGCIAQPVRTCLEAPAGTIEIRSPKARAIAADAAWRAIAAVL
jgi:hypothetical protein